MSRIVVALRAAVRLLPVICLAAPISSLEAVAAAGWASLSDGRAFELAGEDEKGDSVQRPTGLGLHDRCEAAPALGCDYARVRRAAAGWRR